MQTFLFYILILQAEMLAFLISITSAHKNLPLAISAPKHIFQSGITEEDEFYPAFLKDINDNILEFAPMNNRIIIFACPAKWEESEKIKTYKHYTNTSAFILLFTEKRVCHSAIKPDFRIEPSRGCMNKQNSKYAEASIVYRFGVSERYVIRTEGEQFIIEGIDMCFNKDTNRPMYIHYTLYKTTEDDLQNLSFNDVEEISYDVSDTTLNEHLKKIRDDFKSQEEKGYVPHLLAPPDHLIFTLRNLAKHYLNVDLLHYKLIPLMDVIDKRIKEYSKLYEDEEDYLEIFCLTTNEGKESNNEETNHEIAELAPHVWVKVIYDDRRKLAAVIYVHNSTTDYQGKKQCEHQEACNFQEWAGGATTSNLFDQQAYCCALEDKSWLINLLPKRIKVDGFLDINTLQLPHAESSKSFISTSKLWIMKKLFSCINSN